MNSIPESMDSAIRSLMERTVEGKARWVRARALGVGGEGDFALNGGAFMVVLDKGNFDIDPENSVMWFSFKLLTPEGDVGMDITISDADEMRGDYKRLGELYEAARHIAFRVPDMIKNFTDALNTGQNIGRPPPAPKVKPKPGEPVGDPDDYPL